MNMQDRSITYVAPVLINVSLSLIYVKFYEYSTKNNDRRFGGLPIDRRSKPVLAKFQHFFCAEGLTQRKFDSTSTRYIYEDVEQVRTHFKSKLIEPKVSVS